VAAVADLADGLVVVARLGSLRWDDVPALRAALDSIPMEKLGAVAVEAGAVAPGAALAPSGRPATAY